MLEPKFFAKEIEAIKHGGDRWDSHKIGVYQNVAVIQNLHKIDPSLHQVVPKVPEKVGEYIRHYGLMETFHWFTKGGKDYALFSAPDYTGIRIMELPSCKDIGGEEFKSNGFCPVEFYIPSYVEKEFTEGSVKGHRFRIYEPTEKEITETDIAKPLGGLKHEEFGFVAGCVWGDDLSWKLEYLDLSQAEKGILKHDARFGYIELPKNMKLRDAIDMQDGEGYLRIAHEQTFDRETGKKLE